MLRLLALFLLLPTLAFAQDEVTDTSSTYSPDFCEFSVTFPSDPYKSRRCEKEASGKCFDLVSYTQVYEMSSTVNFRVICNPIGQEIKDAYTPEVMKATLRAMTKQSVVQTFNTAFREEETYKQAGLVGEGLVGRTPTIYVAQLWIGEKSSLSVDAELIGEPMEGADTLFSDVLKSVGVKREVSEEEASEDEEEDSEEVSEEEKETKPTEP